jgi:putative ABC transport system permease protein
MLLPSLLRISARNVVRNRRRSGIAFLAIFLSVAVMVGIKGFFNGMQASIVEATVLGQTGALQVHRKGFLKSANASSLSLDLPAEGAFLAKVLAVPGIKAASARIVFSGMVSTKDLSSPALFAALDPIREPAVCPLRMEMVSAGKTLSDSGPSAVLTVELAKSLGLKLEQRAAVLTTDRDGVMSALDFDFVGLYGQPGFALRDKKIGFIPLTFAQALLRMEGRATEIVVGIGDLNDAGRIKPLLQAAVGPEYEVSTWHDVASFVEDLVNRQNFILSLLSGIFLFVALLGIANTMLMSVKERTREIGTMMSLGVRRRQILGLFLLESSLLGLAGGVLGAGIGSGLVAYLGYKGMLLRVPGMLAPVHIHPRVSPGYVLLILVISAGGAALAALWPAIRASGMRPVQALSAA